MRLYKKDIEGLLLCLRNGNEALALIAFNVLLVRGYKQKSIIRMVKKYHV